MFKKKMNNQLNSVPIDGTISSLSSKLGMGGGTVTSIYGWLTTNEAAVLIGLIITVFGFIINLIFQLRRDKRTKAEHELKKKLYDMEIIEHEKRIKLLDEGVIPPSQDHIHDNE